jgi:hypothetical protein
MNINNDSEFKAVLSELPRASQRQVAALFAENVLGLSRDARVRSAVHAARRSVLTDDELDNAYRSAKTASVDSFTQCGRECDWNSQAGHFVAEAALACFKPAEPGTNQAWDAAMHARMARTCESIATGKGTDNAEAAVQYRILSEFMKG